MWFIAKSLTTTMVYQKHRKRAHIFYIMPLIGIYINNLILKHIAHYTIKFMLIS